MRSGMVSEVVAAASTGRTALRWFAGGLVAAPLGILPHEIGHYLVLLALGVPDLALHFVGVTWDLEEFWLAVWREDYATAATIAPLWGVALSDAAGPLVTYALVLACCYGCATWRPHPALVAVAYFAQARINVATQYAWRRLFNSELPSDLEAMAAGANLDELRVAILTGIPVQVLVGPACCSSPSAVSGCCATCRVAEGLWRPYRWRPGWSSVWWRTPATSDRGCSRSLWMPPLARGATASIEKVALREVWSNRRARSNSGRALGCILTSLLWCTMMSP